MNFFKTLIPDVLLIKSEPHIDERGYFTRIWTEDEFNKLHLKKFIENSVSFNHKKGTIRGMHFQTFPFEEAKLVGCMKGRIFDVIVDLRSSSTTYKKWISVELDSQQKNLVYIPEGCAHGFQTLEDDTLVYYQISNEYSPDHSKGINYDDPTIHIDWPLDCSIISQKDRNLPFLTDLK